MDRLLPPLTVLISAASLIGAVWMAVSHALLAHAVLDAHIDWCDERIAAHVRSDAQAHAAMQLSGVGPVTASALAAAVGSLRQFKSGAQFSSWLGLVPSQNSSGGKASLGRITRRGDDYLRTLLIQGAKSAVMTAHRRRDRISQWLVQLLARVGWQKATVALANKNARVLWAVLSKGLAFNADHVSSKPTSTAT